MQSPRTNQTNDRINRNGAHGSRVSHDAAYIILGRDFLGRDADDTPCRLFFWLRVQICIYRDVLLHDIYADVLFVKGKPERKMVRAWWVLYKPLFVRPGYGEVVSLVAYALVVEYYEEIDGHDREVYMLFQEIRQVEMWELCIHPGFGRMFVLESSEIKQPYLALDGGK